MQWHPIAECPPDVRRVTLFCPENFACTVDRDGRVVPGSVCDERIVTADRHEDGTWWVSHDHGGYAVRPTHFVVLAPPAGFPAGVDPAAAQARTDRENAEQGAARERTAAERQANQQALDASYASYWADVAARANPTP